MEVVRFEINPADLCYTPAAAESGKPAGVGVLWLLLLLGVAVLCLLLYLIKAQPPNRDGSRAPFNF